GRYGFPQHYTAANAKSGGGGVAGVRRLFDHVNRSVSAGCGQGRECAELGHWWLRITGGEFASCGAQPECEKRTRFLQPEWTGLPECKVRPIPCSDGRGRELSQPEPSAATAIARS